MENPATNDAIESILSRRSVKQNDGYEKFLRESSEYIKLFVNYGTHLLDAGFKKQRGDIDVPINLLLRKFLSDFDGQQQLLIESCFISYLSLQRIMLETMLYIIFVTDSDYEKRSLAYLYNFYKVKMDNLTCYIQGTKENDRLKMIFEKDRYIHKDFLKNLTTISKMASNQLEELKKALAGEEFTEIKGAVEKIKMANPKAKLEWYTPLTRKNNLRGLSEYLRCEAIYQIIYKDLSKNIHSSDNITGCLGTDEKGQPTIYQIRYYFDPKTPVLNSLSMGRETYRAYCNFLKDGWQFKFETWYRKEIKAFIDKLNKLKIVDPIRSKD